MKYALIIPDGIADEPQEDLGGRTPLAAATLPHADEAVRCGVIGRTDNVPASMPAGSDVGIMSLLGYDPLVCHTGRAPLEAAAQGISLSDTDWAIRCNLVATENGRMKSFTAHQIPSEAGSNLLGMLQRELGCSSSWKFHPGVSYRNLLIHRSGETASPLGTDTTTTPPHDILDQAIEEFLPSGPGAKELRQLMDRSRKLFVKDPSPATQIWLWGEGQRPAMDSFRNRFGLDGAIITAVDLPRGIARLIGWECIDVPGATGYIDTDYTAKGRAALKSFQDGTDLIIIHVEGTDEVSHEGNTKAKVRAIEDIDRHIIGPVHKYLREQGEYRLLVCPDHPTYLRTKTHAHGYCPFAMCGTDVTPDNNISYDEETAASADLTLPKGHELMPLFLNKIVA